jgi:hypothetical protein
MKQILICGDSFAADWTVKYKGQGWPNMLAREHEVHNAARAGVSEYKIYQQVMEADLVQYDSVIIAHTSPYRLYVKEHPVHAKDSLHSDCDLIYSDVKDALPTHPELAGIVEYFERYFDPEYATFVHNLICEKIEAHCNKYCDTVIHMINFEDQYCFKNSVDFVDVFKQHRGRMNHFDDMGNLKVYQKLLEMLK